MIDFHFVTSRRKTVLILLAICGLALLPFLGIADFNTKGEPREAVVAFSILEQDSLQAALSALVHSGGEPAFERRHCQ